MAEVDEASPAAASAASSAAAAPPSPLPAVDDLLRTMAAYAEAEADASLDDYRALTELNRAAAARYGGMAEYSAGLVAFADRLQAKCAEMAPQFAQIDALEAQAAELEGAVEMLDAYSRRLEAKFGALQAPP